MSRQHRGLVRQSKNFFANAANQQWKVASREVCPADASSEENVAVEEDLVAR
jgi:hypothetical protein